MVMAQRPEVATAAHPIAAVDAVGLGQQMANALLRVPFRRPLHGSSGMLHNLGQNVTREIVRTFMGYSSSLPIEEFRSIEHGLDWLSKIAMRPVVALEGVDAIEDVIGGVPGIRYRPRQGEPIGHILYLHGGGYVGTSPNMYAFFTARLAAVTQCEVFVADYRLAPEFPFPAGLHDAVSVLESMLDSGCDPSTLFLAGDSGGGGLASSVIYHDHAEHLPQIGGLLLFSPEIDLRLDHPSVTENAPHDILPWNIPTSAYLHGEAAASAAVSALDQDVATWPPVFLTWGSHEMFRDSIRLLAEHLQAAGVPTTGEEADGMFHVYPILMPWAEHSRRVYRDMGEFVRVQVTNASNNRTEIARRTRVAAEELGPIDEDAAPMTVTTTDEGAVARRATKAAKAASKRSTAKRSTAKPAAATKRSTAKPAAATKRSTAKRPSAKRPTAETATATPAATAKRPARKRATNPATEPAAVVGTSVSGKRPATNGSTST